MSIKGAIMYMESLAQILAHGRYLANIDSFSLPLDTVLQVTKGSWVKSKAIYCTFLPLLSIGEAEEEGSAGSRDVSPISWP